MKHSIAFVTCAGSDKSGICLPLWSHLIGDYIWCSMQSLMAVGCEVVDAPQRFDPPAVADVRYVSTHYSVAQSYVYACHVMPCYITLHVPYHMTIAHPGHCIDTGLLLPSEW